MLAFTFSSRGGLGDEREISLRVNPEIGYVLISGLKREEIPSSLEGIEVSYSQGGIMFRGASLEEVAKTLAEIIRAALG